MMHKLLLSCLVSCLAVINLMALPQSASAQQVIYACKNNTTGVLIVYANTTTCQQGWTLITLNLTGGSGGALAASQFVCLNQTLLVTQSIAFSYPPSASNLFGNSIITPANSSSFTSITLAQSGVYQIDLSVEMTLLVATTAFNVDGVVLLVNGLNYNLYQSNTINTTWTAPVVNSTSVTGIFNPLNVRSLRGSIIISASVNTILQFKYFAVLPDNSVSIGAYPSNDFTPFECKMSITQIH
jgi:hypothetical protein